MGGWYIAGRTKMNKDAKDGQRCEGWKKMRKMILEIHRMDGVTIFLQNMFSKKLYIEEVSFTKSISLNLSKFVLLQPKLI